MQNLQGEPSGGRLVEDASGHLVWQPAAESRSTALSKHHGSAAERQAHSMSPAHAAWPGQQPPGMLMLHSPQTPVAPYVPPVSEVDLPLVSSVCSHVSLTLGPLAYVFYARMVPAQSSFWFQHNLALVRQAPQVNLEGWSSDESLS